MIILLLSDDKLCAQAWMSVRDLPEDQRPIPVLVKTDLLARTFRMLGKRRLKPKHLLAMMIAERRRKRSSIVPFRHTVRSTAELERLIGENAPEACLMFRCGLIIDIPLLATCPFYNIHSASIPAYGGIASVPRAIENGDLAQEATCHEVTAAIDEGRIVDTEPYLLRKELTYRENEEIAYAAGAALLRRVVIDRRLIPMPG